MLMLAQLTFRETLAKKTFMAFFACSSIFLLILIFVFQFDIVEGNEAIISAFGESETRGIELDEIISQLIAGSATTLMTFGTFLSIFATAGLIPSMLEKGTIDLILSKPLSRLEILFGRSIGAMAIVFVNMAYLILGIWLVFGIKTGYWMIELLPMILIVCLLFLIVFCWMVLWGIVLRNSALTIMITYVMFGLSSLLLARDQIYALLSSKFWIYILDGMFYLFPRIAEMISYPVRLINDEAASLEPFITSFIMAIGIFFFAAYLFKKKDF